MLQGIFMQGTTPSQYFELPFPTSLLEKVSVTYRQKKKVILIKRTEDCVLQDNYVIVPLTQEDTLMFNPNYIVEVQVKVKTLNGEVMGCDEYRLAVEEIFDKEVF